MTIASKCVIAGAGTGKTTYLLELALKAPRNDNVLYLTYTNAAAVHFRDVIKAIYGGVPQNITVMTWFSFLLIHGVRPFPYPLPGFRAHGIKFVEGRVPPKRGVTRGKPEYYLANKQNDLYSSRLADLACRCDEQVKGEVVKRISDIFQLILVDEAQDLSSYDYDFVSKLMKTSSSVVLVGDPRQRTYTTSQEGVYQKQTIFEYLTEQELCEIDSASLTVCYRCKSDVVDLSNELFPDLPALLANSDETNVHIAILQRQDAENQSDDFKNAMHLCWKDGSIPINVNRSMTMGSAKGSEFDDVVVWLTKPMTKWFDDRQAELKPEARSKLYVAITRARNNLWLVKA